MPNLPQDSHRVATNRIKNEKKVKKKRNTMRFIYTIFFACSIAASIAILVRSIKIGYIEGPHWLQCFERIRQEKVLVEPAIRGDIYATTGEPLRMSVAYYTLSLDLKAEGLLKLYKKYGERPILDTIAQMVCRNFPDIAQKKNRQLLVAEWQKEKRKGKRIVYPIQRPISYYEYNRFFADKYMSTYDSKGKRKGSSFYYRAFRSDNYYKRTSPLYNLADATIGTLDKDLNIGKSGFERGYDSILRGQDGSAKRTYVSRRPSRIITKPPVHGFDLYTTIDSYIQHVATQALEATLQECYGDFGSATVMETHTGRIVAMCNLDKKSSGRYVEDYNHACLDNIEPGSTFKAASMMIALDEKLVTPNETVDTGNGSWQYASYTISDTGNKHGVMTYTQAMAQSSNVAIAKMIVNGFEHRKEAYLERLKDLGFGLTLTTEIPGAQRSQIPELGEWDKTTLGWLAHGYRSMHPPLAILTFYNGIASGGKLYKPYFVDRIVTKSGKVHQSFQPTLLRDSLCSTQTIEQLRAMLRQVVIDGTGRTVNSPLIEICGKTGTSKRYNKKTRSYKNNGYYISFCGFFPADNPRYTALVTIAIPHGQPPASGPWSGGVVRAIAEAIASKSAQRNIDELLPVQKNSYPTAVASGRLSAISAFAAQQDVQLQTPHNIAPNTLVSVSVQKDGHWIATRKPSYKANVMPDLYGLPLKEAMPLLQKRGLSVHLHGRGHVVAQSIPPGTLINKSTPVIIQLEP